MLMKMRAHTHTQYGEFKNSLKAKNFRILFDGISSTDI